VDAWVRRALRENGTIYTIDEPLLRALRPDVILTQQLCDVCAVGYGTVARLAATLPEPPTVVNLEPSSLADIFANVRQVAEGSAPARAERRAGSDQSARRRRQSGQANSSVSIRNFRRFLGVTFPA
jgi:iron complex transport system substrate-binding protein